ncbi:MAG: S-layer homology domain-containing protein [Acidimicrobiaceae bacterium]|nr:S-layer homology domain-containing protein [Acidimicrobiaceae bacterium]
MLTEPGAAALAQPGGFDDVAENSYYSTPVAELTAAGVFAGTECDEGFCPNEPIGRATMAVWTVRVLDGADPAPVASTRFADVAASHPHAEFVERLAQLGVTGGCGDGTDFCPDDTVTRAQMAVFLSRAYSLDGGPDPGFSDVPDDAWYSAAVAAVAASDITGGCGDGTVFCPGQDTTRAQMATFLWRAEQDKTPQTVADGRSTVIVANGWSPPDIGAAVPLASRLNAPVLYASLDSLGDATIDALGRLEPSQVILVGSLAQLSGSVEAEVRRLVPDARVQRLSGTDSTDTAAKANAMAPAGTWPVVIANPHDAGVAALLAASLGGSALLSHQEALSLPTVEAMRRLGEPVVDGDWVGNRDTYIVGDTAALASSVERDLSRLTDNLERVGGSGRADTAARVALRLAERRPNAPIVLANGESPADVGIAAPYAAVIHGTLLLTHPDRLGEAAATALEQLNVREVVLIGNTDTLGASIESELARQFPNAWVMRIAGSDRVGTAAKAALDEQLRPSAVPPESIGNRISSGSSHSCGLLADLKLTCWGFHASDELNAPKGKFVHVSAGESYSCALRFDQTAACWGNHRRLSEVPGGRFLGLDLPFQCGIRPGGRELCWGWYHGADENAPTSRFTQVSTHVSIQASASGRHSCGLHVDGTVSCWGLDSHGQADAPTGSYLQVVAGNLFSCGLRLDRTVICWGDDGEHYDERNPVRNVPSGRFTEITSGGSYVCGLLENGTAECWGHNGFGRATPPNLRFAPDIEPVRAALAAPTEALVLPTSDCATRTVSAMRPGPVENLRLAFLGAVDSYGRSPDPVTVAWTTACSGGSPQQFIVEWRRAHQRYEDSRRRLVAASDSAGTYVTSVPENNGYAGIYAVRVTPLNPAGMGEPREMVVSTPANDAYTLSEAVVEEFGDRYPWLDTLWVAFHDGDNHVAQYHISARRCILQHTGGGCASAAGISLTYIRAADWGGQEVDRALDRMVGGQSSPRFADVAMEELAHVYDFYSSASHFKTNGSKLIRFDSHPLGLDTKTRAAVTAGLMYLHELLAELKVLGIGGGKCSAAELFGEMPELVMAADGVIPYARTQNACRLPFALAGHPEDQWPDFTGDETIQVFRSVLVDQDIPQWFYDNYLNAHDSWDLQTLRGTLRNIFGRSAAPSDTPYFRVLRDLILDDTHGAYCSETQVREYLDGETDLLPERAVNGSCAAFEAVVSNENHSCALRTDDTIACWGSNTHGQIDAPDGTFTAVSAGLEHTCALRSNQSIACWGRNLSGRTEPPQGEFSSVTSGDSYSCALRTDKSIVCWGSWGANRHGQLDPPQGRFSDIYVGPNHACALSTTGTVACWGANYDGQADAPAGEFAALTVGRDHSCGLRFDGRVVCWGSNERGQADAPDGSFSSIATTSWDRFGYGRTCGVRVDGSVVCWGKYAPEPPDETFSSVAVSRSHVCGLRTDGAIRCWGDLDVRTEDYPLGPFAEVTAGLGYSCGQRADGTITCWGSETRAEQINPPACRESAASAWRACSRLYVPVLEEPALTECPATRHSGGVPRVSYSLDYLRRFQSHPDECECWIAVNRVAYDVMPAVGGYEYPGPGSIADLCGQDATEHFRVNDIDPPDVKFARGTVRR